MNRCPKCQAFTKSFIKFGRCQKCQGLIIGEKVIKDPERDQRPADVTDNQITFLFSDDLGEAVCIIPEAIKNRLSRYGYEETDLMMKMHMTFFDEMEAHHAQNKN